MTYLETLRSNWGVDILVHRPRVFGVEFVQSFGDKLYERDPDLCCHKNKVEPMAELIGEHGRYQGWITGVRRDQASTRAQAETIELLEGNLIKVQPLAHWTRSDVDAYIDRHSIPMHPLFSQGYASIGCAPCTRPTGDSSDERAGRWAGKAKTECGLHTFWKKNPQWKSTAAGAEPPTTG
jgi:phosphoadenosine phosphosulfate reductase